MTPDNRQSRGCRSWQMLTVDDAALLARHGRWYIPERARPVSPAQRARRARQRRRRRATRPSSAWSSATSTTSTRCCGRTRPGPLAVWRQDLLVARASDAAIADELAAPATSPSMRHLLVTNDFPPKVGGIQSYLWELWRRLPSEEVAVLTTPHAGASDWEASRPSASSARANGCCSRRRRSFDGSTRSRIEFEAELVMLDPGAAARSHRTASSTSVRARAPRRRGHCPRPAARDASRCCGTCFAVRTSSSSRRRLRAARGRARCAVGTSLR